MRKLVTLREIDNITPIDGADKIETAHIGGWTVVVKKGEFYIGQRVFYFEIDSLLPLDHCYFQFLRPRGITKVDGREYHRLKTAKLRGQVSQGLILPHDIVSMNWKCDWDEGLSIPKTTETEKSPYYDPDEVVEKEIDIHDNYDGDYSKYFDVIKYEPPVPAELTGQVLPFPAFVRKTDEERIQNLSDLLPAILEDQGFWIATEKIDGTSCSIWARINNQGILEYGVCSRNWGIVEDDNNTMWKLAKIPMIHYSMDMLSPLDYLKLKCLEDARSMKETNTPIYILQGEVFGEGIQKNPLGIKGQKIRFFNFFKNGEQLPIAALAKECPELEQVWVPIHQVRLADTLDEIIKQPDDVKSKLGNHSQIEGFVWRHTRKSMLDTKNRASFKAISSKYLLKHEG